VGGSPGTGRRGRVLSYEELREGSAELPRGMRLALEAGIGHEREFIRFRSELRESG